MSDTRAERIARIVRGVIEQALRDAGARAIVLLDDGSPEAGLARAWLAPLGGALLTEAGAAADPDAEEELRRRARVRARAAGALTASAANKTALLLTPVGPPEPLLPLGDLYASQIEALCGAWSAPAEVRALADAAGGIAALDGALVARIERRRPEGSAFGALPPEVRSALGARLAEGRWWRRRAGLVPKLGMRSIGADLLE